MPVVGVLSAGSPENPTVAANVMALRQGLAETGYVEGQNLAIEYRWAEGSYGRLPAMAADLVDRQVNVVATIGGTPSALAAKGATSAIPIVFVTGDPIEAGLVTNLARPNGNLTGLSILSTELMPKRLQLLSELVPRMSALALLINPNNPAAERMTREVRDAARSRGVLIEVLTAETESQVEAVLAKTGGISATHALVVGGPDPAFAAWRNRLVASALRHAVPAIYAQREFPAAGGLISYGTSFPAVYHQAGIYVAKILNGAKPADLPVQQPTKFELVINLKTAKALGLTVPQSILARADEVIE
jgi:putative ABC transport system substrate-binding protein